MIDWHFYIDDVEVEEPQGWVDLALEINRDQEWHGIFFEASTSTLGFFGEGADMLRSKKDNQGLAATATFRAEAICGEEVDVLDATLDFGTYNERCGTTCIVRIGVEKKGCTMMLRNRLDQKVDLDKNTAYDNQTVLAPYPGLNFPLDMPAQALDARAEAYVALSGEEIDYQHVATEFTSMEVDFRPDYERSIFDSIDVAQFTPSVQVAQSIAFDENVSPFLLFQDNLNCYPGLFNWEFRMKGRFSIDHPLTDMAATIKITTWDGVGTWEFGRIVIIADQFYSSDDYVANTVVEFDINHSGAIALSEGIGLYAQLTIGDGFSGAYEPIIHVEFDPETYGLVYQTKTCPTTEAVVSLINETGSRIVESITDGCLRMKSDYLGRTDSQPYASAEDGCGSLRVLTSGLRLRVAENPTHFISLDEFFKGLRGIDNVGMGVEADTEQGMGKEWLRVEPVEYFYQDQEVFRSDFVPEADWLLDPTLGYSLVKIGYQKWEVERINGLDEFNSNKEFRTSLSTINNPLDALSPFVAGGQAIEVTRQQSFANSGGADTSYDNENFIICLVRDVYGYIVEQGNIMDAANFFSPATAYNWRIRPFYNLMRWWKSVAQTYRNLGSTLSKLFFAGGTGNLLARGRMADDCELANAPLPENWDLAINNFKVSSYPVHKPDRVTYSYPFSLRNYLDVKANPYGYISVQCGNGAFVKAYIISIQYSPSNGTALFNLKLQWPT